MTDRRCAVCGHVIKPRQSTGGLDWQCEEGCRCLMLGCVPRSKKYGTELEDTPSLLDEILVGPLGWKDGEPYNCQTEQPYDAERDKDAEA